MLRRIFVPALAALTFAVFGCGSQQLSISETDGTSSNTAARLTSETQLHFQSDWTNVLSSALVNGSKVRVIYDTDRLPQCRGDYNGQPAWSITGYWQLNGGAVHSFEAGGYSPSQGTEEPVFELTDTGDLAMWFQITNQWGCSAWDSNYGSNYHFSVQQQPTLTFTAAWQTEVQGVLASALAVTVSYDLSRLPTCRQTYNGYATWDIVAWYRFDGGAAQSIPVTAVSGSDKVSAPAEIAIPSGAQTLELWFENTDRTGCVAWDSAYGQNYVFSLN